MSTLADLNTYLTAVGQPNLTAEQANRVQDWLTDTMGLETPADFDDLGAYIYTTIRQQVISFEKRGTNIVFYEALMPGKGRGRRNKFTLFMPDGAFGDQITATVDPAPDETHYWVLAEAMQDGHRVYAQYQHVFEGQAGPFTLGPTPSWPEGEADGYAEMGYFRNGRWRVVAKTEFDISE